MSLVAACTPARKTVLKPGDLYDAELERRLVVEGINWSRKRKPLVVSWEGIGDRLYGFLDEERLIVTMPSPYPVCTGSMDLAWGRWELVCGENLSAKGDTSRRASVYALLGDGVDGQGRKVVVYLKKAWCPEGGCRQGED